MQVDSLLRQVHHHIALANYETDHKIENNANQFTYKNLLQVRDEVLLHWPQTATAQSSHLQWIGNFTITKTNNVMCQVQDENGTTTWILCGHIRHIAARLPHTFLSQIS